MTGLLPKRTAVMLLTLAVHQAPAGAAVRSCVVSVSGGPQSAVSLGEAKKLAIGAWIKAAATAGIPGATWRMAATKSLTCQPFTEHSVVCEARATPCVIEQAPGNPSPGGPPVAPPARVVKPINT